MTGEFPAQKASKAENVILWWRHHELVQISAPILIIESSLQRHYQLWVTTVVKFFNNFAGPLFKGQNLHFRWNQDTTENNCPSKYIICIYKGNSSSEPSKVYRDAYMSLLWFCGSSRGTVYALSIHRRDAEEKSKIPPIAAYWPCEIIFANGDT